MGIPGEYYPATALRSRPVPAERAPEARHGLEWVGTGLGRPLRVQVFGGGDGPRTTTPCGRARALQALSWDLSECRLWANIGEI